jgi:DDE superfamily endonuclease
MWTMIPSLERLVHELAPAFTEPMFRTHCQLLLGWLMCLSARNPYRVCQAIHADQELPRSQRPPFDRFYNFFSRSAWGVSDLAYQVAVAIVTRLNPTGLLYLVVDDTLLHKRGKKVWGLGWFRDAVASTKKRVATAPGHNWVVLGLAVPLPWDPERILCLALTARLHRPGKGQPSCPQLAREMLDEVLGWFPGRRAVLVGDGAYATKAVLEGLDPRAQFVGRLRADAALYAVEPRRVPKGRPGPKPHKGARLPSPKQAAAKADRNRNGQGPWVWREVTARAYGRTRALLVLSYRAVWPHVLGLEPVLVVVVRDPEQKLKDTYLLSTAAEEEGWVVEAFARRWSVEVLFRASKQELGIEGPQHWCESSVQKVAPWVWLTQSVLTLWYVTEGHTLPEAAQEEALMGPWDSDCSLRHVIRVLRRATLNATITVNSQDPQEVTRWLEVLKNCVNLAA